jgi:hypothetical protein
MEKVVKDGVRSDHKQNKNDKEVKRLHQKSRELKDFEKLEYFYLLGLYETNSYDGACFGD